MVITVRRYIDNEKLLSPWARVVVGLSGGMDSMALLDILTLLGYNCVAAHCNFHLRGDESDRDAAFVKKWCSDSDIQFTSVDFDTAHYAAAKKISIEMAARELRYSWFEKVRKQYGAYAVAVAHHKDDSVETVLLNLIRGSGVRGLTGIASKNKNVVRPMLCVTRAEIEEYITNRGIPYVTDSTNNEDFYLRNYIRINIIPLLKELNPSVCEAINRTSRNISEAEKVYSEYIHKIIKSVCNNNKIDIRQLRQTASPQSVLYEILSPLGFNTTVIENILQSMDSNPGKVFYSEGYRVVKDRNSFLIGSLEDGLARRESYLISDDTEEITDPVCLAFHRKTMPVEIDKSSNYLYADADKLKFPLKLRRWRQGDWFVPFGMKGKKKLSDYFTDRKFSLPDKEDVWVLLSGDDIVWIVGERSDNRFRITERSINAFMVEYRGC